MVVLTGSAKRDLEAAPPQAVVKLQAWIAVVETLGIGEARKQRGFADHPLKGKLKGKRAIRLTLKWRAVYTEQQDGALEFARVEQVHPHTYR